MSDRERKLWPFKPRTSIVAAVLILFGLLLTLVILQVRLDWPSPESETAVLLGILLLSLLPILLVLVDTMIERGGMVEYRGVKIDFSQVQGLEISGPTIPANIGELGYAVAHSGTIAILDALRQAVASDMVIIDLEEGQAWWETRLLVLLAGAIRHRQPKTVVFVGTYVGVKKRFQGWASASELLPHLLKAHPKYPSIYHSALAAARQWEMVEPSEQEDAPPPHPAWIQSGLANVYAYMAFESNLPNKFFAEQLMASELAEKVEQKEESPRTLNLFRLEDLFRPVLHQEHIDELWPSERQLEMFFDRDVPYLAITQDGQFKSLVSRISVLNTMVSTLVRGKAKEIRP